MAKRLKLPSLLTLVAMLAGCAAPSEPFDITLAPPAPDYDHSESWMALPGRPGLEHTAPAGLAPITEADALADVFFIHPTTSVATDIWNARWDASGDAAPLSPAVLLGQVSVFNGCCRIYAPHYRQATLPALSKSPGAVDLAYSDVAAAFRQFISSRNNRRPFILASHSQGTGHAIRLLQTEILGTPLQSRMIAAYLIGGYVPDTFPEIGLPICDAPDQVGCVLAWNAAKPQARLARIVVDEKPYWWKGGVRTENLAQAICVNPLTWRDETQNDEAASAILNPGSIPLPRSPFGLLSAPTPNLTGARCHARMLEVDLGDAPETYSDRLTRLAGSYHLNDYGLFYVALRENAVLRVLAWTNSQPSPFHQSGRS